MRKAILGLAPLLLAIGTHAAAQAPAWRVSEVSGDVRIVEGGQSRAAARGMLLSSGSTIATAARARAVITRGQEYVVVSPASRLRVPDAPQGRGGIIQMIADWGTALFRIERQATPHFGVQTPYLAAVVKGTVFTVTVGEAGGSVQVTEGAVEVSTLDGGAVELIRPGMIANVSGADLQLLNIEGEESRSIRSNGTPISGTVTVPAPQATAYAGPAQQVIEITAPVTEESVSLSETTGGLIEGRIGIELALADIADQSRIPEFVDGPDPVADDGGAQTPATNPPPADPGTPPADPGIPPPAGDAGAPPPGDGAGTPPPADDGGTPPPADDGGTPPPVDDSGTPPPADDGGPPPPADDGGTPPPVDDSGTPPPADDGGPPPPADDGGTPPPADDGGTPPPADDGGTPPPADDGGTPPPADDGGTPPPADDGSPPPADDGNNGHGNDDGQDDSNPGSGGGGTPPVDDDGTGIEICLPGDLICLGVGGGGPDPGVSQPSDGDPPDDGGIGICLPGDLICLGLGGPAGGDDDGPPPICLPLLCRGDD